jgi:hypothetical protein
MLTLGTGNCGVPYCKRSVTRVSILSTVKTRYPILYCMLVLPLSVVRWITFTTTATQLVATLVVEVVFSLSGILNALLYALTRSRIIRPDVKPPPLAPHIHEAPAPAIS